MEKEEFIKKYAVERRNTNSSKWDGLESQFGETDLLPLWVADTEFKVPEAARKALVERVEHGAFGYSLVPDSYYEAYFNWQKERYGIELHKDWMRFGTGVVQSLSTLIETLTVPGEAIMVLQPVYYPFMRVIENNNRKLVISELVNHDGHYEMDYGNIQKKMQENNVKLLIFCSPHNPVSRVWSEDELEKLLSICHDEKVRVIADEIHHDLIIGDKKFTSMLSIKDGFYRDNLVMVDAPSKTFNMASLLNSHVVIPNPQIRDLYDEVVGRLSAPQGSLLGRVAAEAAYREGAEWLDNMIEVIRDNFVYVRDELTKAFPKIKVSDLEGTYLMWIDLSALVPADKVEKLVKKQAKLAVDFGDWFGESGKGHIRVNLATTPENIKKAVSALVNALKSEN
ncbi:MalY/PatB family protein [Ligilactobacillus salivarius]|uniref:cysteine-S-conjugate beta-lyase n=1 Tax=Ligilactobacillus salivarius TaxID=1624 RepID=A0A089QEL5_9LACO|nr:MalY/PatB family protein [Ligilactobacillus salivarius]AIR11195.1 Aminotransferase [Ligilactobacillus salivarius]